VIPDQWYPILEVEELRPGRPLGLIRLGRDLVLWRDDAGRVACFPDRCSHRAARLSRGRIRDGCLECPFHGLRFDAAGRCVRIPANGREAPIPGGFDLVPCPVREGHGLIWYWHGETDPGDAQLPWFADTALERGVSASASRTLPVHYLRIMEQASDHHHAPFVHRSLYPRLGTRVDDYEARADGPLIRVQGTLHDLPALRSQQLDDPADVSRYHLLVADRGAALFFSLRHRLLREAASRRATAP
jgi:phenylpropionate dioxygenase-like ring-hydroxylating dioxygenase large terminal subunit